MATSSTSTLTRSPRLHDLFDRLDPTPGTQLADVDQTVGARLQVDERAEVRGRRDPADDDLARLDLLGDAA